MNNSVSNATEQKLPRGWRWVALGDVCTVQKGATPRAEEYTHSGLRLVKFRDIGGKKINWTPGIRSFVNPECAGKLRQLKVGMTLISADAHSPAFIGKKVTFVEHIPEEPAYFSGEIIAVSTKADSRVVSKWLFFWLSSHYGYTAIQEKVVGVHLNKKSAERIEIPLPPLAEQKRIVAVLNKVEKARAAAMEQVEATGALPLAYFRKVSESKGGNLPRGWRWVALGDVADYINGMAFKPEQWQRHGLPIVRIQNLNNASAPYNYYSGDVLDKYLIKDGDLLVSWSASLDAYIWNRGKAVLNQHIFKVLENSSVVERIFLYFAIKNAMDSIKAKIHGATMQHITKPDFESVKITLPPLAEQKRNVAVLNKMERARVAADDGLESIIALSSALLHKALNGNL